MAEVRAPEPRVNLVDRLRAGDVEAFEQAARDHQARLLRIAGRFLTARQDAEDVVQEALVDAYRGLRGFRGEASFGTWLTRITLRKALRAARRAAGSRATAHNPAPDGPLPDQATTLALRASVDRLPADLRAPVVLRFYEGLSGREIAELLGCRQSTVWARLYRALRILRSEMEGAL
jgi:RNA polymerase sigma-70 factor (ECF subfamily)